MKCKIEITHDDGKIVMNEGTAKKISILNLSLVEKPNHELGIMEYEQKKPLTLRYEIILELGDT